MIVLVNGLGNIGQTLTNLLLRYQEDLGIDEIWACKRTINSWIAPDLERLKKKGVSICTVSSNDFGIPELKDVLPRANYIFEATANGVGLSNLTTYKDLDNLVGACAQGSEKGFGVSFMSGVSNNAILGEKFVHVVSCNTHGSAALLKTFGGDRLENIKRADMVVVRRSEDIGNHQRLVTANVVARHLDSNAGTHHSIDVIDLYRTMDIDVQLTSSDITTPSQLMHSVRFNIELNEPMSASIYDLILQQPLLASTAKFDSNVIFELGRRYGFQGRIYSHAIILKNNILVEGEKQIKGWAFVPQEGNSLLSTIHAYLLQTQHRNEAELINKITDELCEKEW